MRKIYGIGETLLDIIFKGGQPQAAKPGGSVLNSIVSLGRLGLPVSFISEYGSDNAGRLIDSFLHENGVDTGFVHRFTDGSTSLALAFLDENNDASYTFYKDFPRERLAVVFPEIAKGDIVQCGSFYAIWPEIRTKFLAFMESAFNNGGLVYYDPNFRRTHISELHRLKPLVIENMKLAAIVRGSDEDFLNIFGAAGPDEAWKEVRKYSPCLIYTSSTNGVWVRTENHSGMYPVRKIDPVSTIGAGDNFNAGIISSLFRLVQSVDEISKLDAAEWEAVVAAGVDFATHVCLSYENYIDLAFASRYRSASSDQI